MSSLLKINDLESSTIKELLAVAVNIKSSPEQYRQALQGKHFAMLFEKPSLRTRASFSVGIEKMGGQVHFYDMQHEKIGQRESVIDLAKNLEQWYQGVIARVDHFATLEKLQQNSVIPVINALCDQNHPCQALADVLTMYELDSNLSKWHLAYLGDFNNVSRSLVDVALKLNFKLTLVTPKTPPLEVLLSSQPVIENELVQWLETPEKLAACDIIYTDVWQSMGAQPTSKDLTSTYLPYQVTEKVMAQSGASYFMHCQPVHRGEEVTAEVCDSTQSLMYQQAQNRMIAQQALLFLMFNGGLK